MRKFLLFSSVVGLAMMASAVEPSILPDTFVLGVSPDGKMLVSSDNGTIKVINTETGEIRKFEGESVAGYNLGLGRPISNDNVVVGTRATEPVYYENGRWNALVTPYLMNDNLANSITPDGSRICGSIGAQAFDLEDNETPMQIPVVWDRLPDGTYDDPVILPYPTEDYTGRMPQYVIAVAMSDDGNTVVGNMVDYTGFVRTLIYYTLEDGEWVMHNDFMKLANPNNIEIPPYPGDTEPIAPDPLSFMTDEERANYLAAVAAWEANTPDDFSLYPKEEDYCTAEEWSAYLAAWEAYSAASETWYEDYAAWALAMDRCNSQSIIFNNILVAGDAKKVVSTAIVKLPTPPGSIEPVNETSLSPIVFDLETGEYKIFTDRGMNASFLANDGTILAFDNVGPLRQAWVYLPGETDKPISMMQYMEQKNPATADWMKQNMIHDITGLTETGYEVLIANYECTGTPCASPDLSVVVCAALNAWDYSTETVSYVLPCAPDSGIQPAVATTDTSLINIYDITGRLVRANAPANGADHAADPTRDLPAGLYIANGRKILVK